MAKILSCSQFTQWLVDQQPNFDSYIIRDIRPSDSGWISHVTSGTFEAWSGTSHTRDRFNNVYPNVTKTWLPVSSAGCIGTPCDKNEHLIAWGSTRLVYSLEEQSWQTPLLCFDQQMHITHAREQFGYIISKILKPAVSFIQSNFLRKRGAQFADNKFVANRNFGTAASAFTYNWIVVGDEEIYIDANVNPASVFKLTPQMLQRLVEPLMRIGYLGEMPFKEERNPPMLELVTDTQTLWDLDKLGGQQGIGGVPSVTGNWRFTEWEAANKYWRYGFSGQIGNFAVRVDPLGLRFNSVGLSPAGGGLWRYQVVLPYKNVPSSGAGSQAGIKSVNNPDFDNAQFAFSYVWHQKGIEVLVADAQPVNSEMPFASRNFAGKWQFVMDNLGADVNGCVIENKRRNKGQFIADFKQAIAPNYTEFLVLIFHLREPSCVIEIQNCNASPGYPVQSYSSSGTSCADIVPTSSVNPTPVTLTFTPTLNAANGDYEVPANSASCEGSPLTHQAITGSTTLAAFVTQLNQFLGAAGVWSVASATTIRLVGICNTFGLPMVA